MEPLVVDGWVFMAFIAYMLIFQSNVMERFWMQAFAHLGIVLTPVFWLIKQLFKLTCWIMKPVTWFRRKTGLPFYSAVLTATCLALADNHDEGWLWPAGLFGFVAASKVLVALEHAREPAPVPAPTSHGPDSSRIS